MTDDESQQAGTIENPSSNEPLKPSLGLALGWRILILMGVLVAMGAAILVVVNTQNTLRLQEELNNQRGAAQQLHNFRQQAEAQLNQQQAAIQSVLSGLEQLRSSTNKDPLSPILVEVDYLARLANYNAQYEGNAKVVLALLEAAERRVSSVTSPQLAEVRGALVSNITALKGIKPVDVEGVLLRLNVLSQTVSDLPVVRQAALVPAATKVVEEKEQVAVGKSDWKEKLMANLSSLKKVVVVQRLSDPVKPLMSPEQHINLIENIQLKLAVAEWAVLHHESAIYTAALAQAKDWVSHNFSDSDMTRAMVTGLTELEKIEVKPALPDLGSLVTVVDQAMQAHQQSVGIAAGAVPSPVPGLDAPTAGGSANKTPSSSKNNASPQESPAQSSPAKEKPENTTEPEAISS